MGEKLRKVIYPVNEASERSGLREEFLLHCVKAQWLHAAMPAGSSFDEEDLARARLIYELQEDFGVNDEAIPLILHLLDQLYYLESLVQRAPLLR